MRMQKKKNCVFVTLVNPGLVLQISCDNFKELSDRVYLEGPPT